ncbi:ZIP family metal transporter [Sutterella parvirubra]|uniref:Metal cation transporter, ZIP family n=1 Tax=Sutterella parvirubra YIT 11816 TaxID=762967 RepID=H3KF94_9BURK|nr:ZIP family metal transporter [Sutterella parvirubra]EHY31214.1 metal cation transporter, ZIP family [Sutterella parvirubra YIT 11816]MDR3771427.1 ZIP family metal transporter [Sutterella sp.]
MTDFLITSPVVLTLLGTGFTFLCTTIGAAAVFFTKNDAEGSRMETMSLGFAAGIMTAAAVWSLLIPAGDAAQDQGLTPWIVTTVGFIFGALFLKLLDSALPHLHPGSATPEGPKTSLHRAQLLFLAITLHNLPEGGSVGLSAGLAGLSENPVALSSALALAIGIGLQNIPEGAAVSIPMASQGHSRWKAFLFGTFSGVVEPICGLIVVLGLPYFMGLMPWMLAFAAGAMIYVVVEELVPSAHLSEHSDLGTLSFMTGFAIMMALDMGLSF